MRKKYVTLTRFKGMDRYRVRYHVPAAEARTRSRVVIVYGHSPQEAWGTAYKKIDRYILKKKRKFTLQSIRNDAGEYLEV